MPEVSEMEHVISMNPSLMNNMNNNNNENEIKLAHEFNMNIHLNSEMDILSKHSNVLLMNAPSKIENNDIDKVIPNDNMNSGVRNEVSGTDAMQLAAKAKLNENFDLELQNEEKEELNSRSIKIGVDFNAPKLNVESSFIMPEIVEENKKCGV